jgi:hypothetical protein
MSTITSKYQTSKPATVTNSMYQVKKVPTQFAAVSHDTTIPVINMPDSIDAVINNAQKAGLMEPLNQDYDPPYTQTTNSKAGTDLQEAYDEDLSIA